MPYLVHTISFCVVIDFLNLSIFAFAKLKRRHINMFSKRFRERETTTSQCMNLKKYANRPINENQELFLFQTAASLSMQDLLVSSPPRLRNVLSWTHWIQKQSFFHTAEQGCRSQLRFRRSCEPHLCFGCMGAQWPPAVSLFKSTDSVRCNTGPSKTQFTSDLPAWSQPGDGDVFCKIWWIKWQRI